MLRNPARKPTQLLSNKSNQHYVVHIYVREYMISRKSSFLVNLYTSISVAAKVVLPERKLSNSGLKKLTIHMYWAAWD